MHEHHQQFVITKQGRKVAKIIPYELESKRNISAVIKAMDALAQEIRPTYITLDDILKMRNESRK